MFLKYLLIILKAEREYERVEKSPNCWFISQMSTTARGKPGYSHELKTLSVLFTGDRNSVAKSITCCFQGVYQKGPGTGSKAGTPVLQYGIWGFQHSNLTLCQMFVPTSRLLSIVNNFLLPLGIVVMLVSAIRRQESLLMSWKAPLSIPELFRGLVPSSIQIQEIQGFQ